MAMQAQVMLMQYGKGHDIAHLAVISTLLVGAGTDTSASIAALEERKMSLREILEASAPFEEGIATPPVLAPSVGLHNDRQLRSGM